MDAVGPRVFAVENSEVGILDFPWKLSDAPPPPPPKKKKNQNRKLQTSSYNRM